MRVDNRTAYDSRTLARIVGLVFTWMAKDLDRGADLRRGRFKRLRVEVKYARGQFHSGCAWLHGTSMILRVPRPHLAGERYAAMRNRFPSGTLIAPDDPSARVDCAKVHAFAWLTWHELLHFAGYNHDKFTASAMRGDDSAERFAWLVEALGMDRLPLAEVKAKAKPAPMAVVALKLERIAEREKMWHTKAKRASTALKKLAKQRKYYEKKALAAGGVK